MILTCELKNQIQQDVKVLEPDTTVPILDQDIKHATGHAVSGNMKIKDVITEAIQQADITKRQQEATRGLHRFQDIDGRDRTYELYRIMLAAACSDGVNDVPDHVDPESWAGRFNIAAPLTQQEQKMLIKAYKKMGSKYVDLNKGDLRSMELGSVNKQSPIAKPKKNRYGV